MHLSRLFSTAKAKGTENYIDSQKKYEIIRTILYFGISAILFVAGWIQTGNRTNLLTVVAILGCLPASKSAVNAIMFCKFHSCNPEQVAIIKEHSSELFQLYDCVFTSYKKNFIVNHITIKGNTICGYTSDETFNESDFHKHISDILKLDGHKDATFKVFTSLPKYIERIEQIKELDSASDKSQSIIQTLKSVML